jgi:hypothetical protein
MREEEVMNGFSYEQLNAYIGENNKPFLISPNLPS